MISTKEKIVSDINTLSETKLRKVSEYLDFLRFRDYQKTESALDEAEIEALYTEFSDDDHRLAEVGLDEYSVSLQREDIAL